jgi:hypothetical protein
MTEFCNRNQERYIVMQLVRVELICSLILGHSGEHYDDTFFLSWG